ncbi:nicotinate phosphoribosyltransferase [Oscillospiraceae bacterium LCP25S3_E10]|nr:nicotinate phosphoribosyltransferase [Ruminococcus sp.]MDD6447988.1 nicotinate phosphoribosyltransferase [Ruminococcus sp.]
MNSKLNTRNLTMLTDFYEITMANGYFRYNLKDTVATFDMFFRKVPDNGGFAIMCGLQQVIEYLTNLKFTDEDISYLRSKYIFSEEFLQYLKNFEFSCDVYAVEEGTPIFPNEPIVTVTGPVIQAQFVETAILLYINHMSLIATKANRIVRASGGRAVMEFGARRAQGGDAAIYGARAAYIGGCVGTSNVISDCMFDIPAMGTMAHSWVQLFDSEEDAFRAYAETYPSNCVLLVDTYNTIKSGVPNAIKVFNEVLVPKGYRPKGIRIDSGDIAYLSKKARVMLDEAGFEDCSICASNSLDEYIIRDLLEEGAKIDNFGIGEKLITASSEPVFGGVYKLAAVEKNGEFVPKIKISDNVSKITTPCQKELWRLYDKESGKAIADVLTLLDENIDDTKPYTIFDPDNTWKKKELTNFNAVKLRKQIFSKGKCVYTSPSVKEIKSHCEQQLQTLWSEVTRFDNPHKYYVDLSKRLWDIKHALLTDNKK